MGKNFNKPQIIEDMSEKKYLIDMAWGHEHQEITKEVAQALLDGDMIGWNDGEYTHTLQIKSDDK